MSKLALEKVKRKKNSSDNDDSPDISVSSDMSYKDIANSELMQRLQNLLLHAHEYTAKHSSRVVKFSLSLAKKCNLSELDTEKIRVAAELHDIGKLGIGKDILNKPSKLTEQEYEKIKKHPEIALKLLKELSFMMDVVNIVYYHHEKIDGTGYPENLKGDNIPLGARIISIADAYDAMTSDRVYRKAMSKSDAISELIKFRGTQFDSDLVDLFIETLND